MSKWWAPSKPNEIKPIPWLAPEAISYLEKLIQPEWEIIEHGSGGSTLWFAERAKCVTAFENNTKWADEIEKHVSARKAAIVSGFYTGFPVDLLLIDGEPVQDRAKWITDAPKIVKPGGYIVLDNANRPEYATEREGLKQYADLIRTIDSNTKSGCTYLVTEFWRMR